MSLCYLAVPGKGKRVEAKRRLLADPNVRYVIDHKPHIKAVTIRGRRPDLGDTPAIRTTDQTEHTDERLWDFATDAARHILAEGYDESRGIATLIHYLHNILDVPEAEHLAYIYASRRWVDFWLTDEKSHGWEIEELKRAGLL